jgi:hypothetical protein
VKESLAAYTAAVALVALAMFAPTNASAQVNIYVGPGMPTMATDTGIRITDMATATIVPMATANTAGIQATTVAIGAMDAG